MLLRSSSVVCSDRCPTSMERSGGIVSNLLLSLLKLSVRVVPNTYTLMVEVWHDGVFDVGDDTANYTQHVTPGE